jgi:chromosome segregation ATPase
MGADKNTKKLKKDLKATRARADLAQLQLDEATRLLEQAAIRRLSLEESVVRLESVVAGLEAAAAAEADAVQHLIADRDEAAAEAARAVHALAEAETRAVDAQGLVAEAEGRTAAALERAAEAERWAESAQGRAADAEERAGALAVECETLTAHRDHVIEERDALVARVAAAEAAASEAREHAEAAEAAAAEASVRTQSMGRDLAAATAEPSAHTVASRNGSSPEAIEEPVPAVSIYDEPS